MTRRLGELIMMYAKAHKKFSLPLHWEMILAESSADSYHYAEHTKKRFIFGELAISKSPYYSLLYSRYVLGDKRFLLGERAISSVPFNLLTYADHIFNGRLPDELHKKMILFSFNPENSKVVQAYVDLYEKRPSALHKSMRWDRILEEDALGRGEFF